MFVETNVKYFVVNWNKDKINVSIRYTNIRIKIRNIALSTKWKKTNLNTKIFENNKDEQKSFKTIIKLQKRITDLLKLKTKNENLKNKATLKY